MPGEDALRLREECSQRLGTCSCHAAAIRDAALGVDYLGNQLAHRLVGAQLRRHDAIAIEVIGREQARQVGEIGHHQCGIGGLAHIQQHPQCGFLDACTLGVVIRNRRHWQPFITEQNVRVDQPLATPLHRIQNLGHSDLAIRVFVEQRSCARIKLKPCGRAIEHRPQFGVEAVEVA